MKPKIFIAYFPWPYILNDLNILKSNFNIRTLIYKGIRRHPRILINMFKGCLWSNLIISYTADTHTFLLVLLSKILGKKIFVILTGYETANIPEINYGVMRFPYSFQAWKTRFILKNADKIIVCSEFHKKEALTYISSKRISRIYWGIDVSKFKPGRKKENLVITVGGVTNINTKRKGLETFVKSAKYLPNLKFILIGKHYDNSIDYLKSIAPSNVLFAGFVPDEELIRYYQKAKVYCQVSLHEAFGVSLAEAMACECVPVVTNQGALPEVVGNTGFYVPYGDVKATAEAIEKALLSSNKGKEARGRVVNKFSLRKREGELLKLIYGI